MASSFQSSHKWSFLSEFSPEDHRLAESARSNLEDRQKKFGELREQKLSKLAEKVERQIHNLLGAKNARELHQLMTRESLALRDLCQPPGGLTLDFAKANRARKAKADRLLQQFGAGRERLAKIIAESQREFGDLLVLDEGKVVPGHNLRLNLAKWKKLSPLHSVPLPWGEAGPPGNPDDPNRWFVFQPPFFGFDWSFLQSIHGNFRIERNHVVDPPAGLVGNDVMLDCDDAGSVEGAWAEVETRIAFGFEAPAAGLLEVLIDAQCSIATHYVRTEDEWGWSDSHTRHRNYLLLRVLHPNAPEPSFALMDDWEWESAEDETEEHENLIRGQHYYTQLLSSGPVPGGQSVVIEVGTRSWDVSTTNDVELHSKSIFHWFINSVEVRILP